MAVRGEQQGSVESDGPFEDFITIRRRTHGLKFVDDNNNNNNNNNKFDGEINNANACLEQCE